MFERLHMGLAFMKQIPPIQFEWKELLNLAHSIHKAMVLSFYYKAKIRFYEADLSEYLTIHNEQEEMLIFIKKISMFFNDN